MHFAFCVDANYVKYAGILMQNIWELHQEEQLYFHFVTTGVDPEDEKNLDAFAAEHVGSVFLSVYDASELLEEIPLSAAAPPRLNKVVFLRILLSECLPDDVDRVIYMDADMLVLSSLKELWHVDLQGKAIAAVPYFVEEKENITPLEKYQQVLGFKQEIYFNAGLMVQDLNIWRKSKLAEKVIACYLKNVSRFNLLEQDSLNMVLGENYVPLASRYNVQREANRPNLHYPVNTAVLHLVNEAKQWCMGCNPVIYKLYLPYVQRSHWRELTMQEPATVKSAYLAAMNAELRGDLTEALKYYKATAQTLLYRYYRDENIEGLFSKKNT